MEGSGKHGLLGAWKTLLKVPFVSACSPLYPLCGERRVSEALHVVEGITTEATCSTSPVTGAWRRVWRTSIVTILEVYAFHVNYLYGLPLLAAKMTCLCKRVHYPQSRKHRRKLAYISGWLSEAGLISLLSKSIIVIFILSEDEYGIYTTLGCNEACLHWSTSLSSMSLRIALEMPGHLHQCPCTGSCASQIIYPLCKCLSNSRRTKLRF